MNFRLAIVAVALWGTACRTTVVAPLEPEDASGEPTAEAIPWSEVEPVVAAKICVRSFERPDGSFYTLPLYADNCEVPITTPLEQAVDEAWKDAKAFLISLDAVDEAARVFAKEPITAAMVEQVRGVWMQEAVLRVLVPRLHGAMERRGLSCSDCPAFDPLPERSATWAEVAPYFAAHIWPDPVVTPRDAKGKPTGEPRYTMHVCGGLNGIAEIADPDPVLVQAGFLAAFHNDAAHEKAVVHFTQLRDAPEFRALQDDEARTRFLRKHLSALLLADLEIERGACRVLERFRVDLGLRVECGP